MTQPSPDPGLALTECLACDLAAGALPLPGGTIHRTNYWTVEHIVGPLGVGTLIVKPLRHVLHVADLDDQEVAEMGRLLRDAARLVSELGAAEQVYVCLWSHANREPGHIHYVIQPATARLMDRFDAFGPALQMAMFTTGEAPDSELVSAFADQARAWFAKHTASHQ